MVKKIIMLSGDVGSGKTTAANHIQKCYGGRAVGFADRLKQQVNELFQLGDAFDFDSQEQKMLPQPKSPFVLREQIDFGNLALLHSTLSGVRIKDRPVFKPMQAVNILSTQKTNLFFDSEMNPIPVEQGLLFQVDQIGQVYVESKTAGVFQLYFTVRSMLVLIGTQCRCIDPTVWVRSAISKIKNENIDIAIISDFRHPNEYTVFEEHFENTETQLITIRLCRNHGASSRPEERALDSFEFDYFVHNESLNATDLCHMLDTIMSK